MSWIELVAQRRPPQAPAGMQPPDNAKDWFKISNSAEEADTTDILIYDSVGGWFGMWAEDMVAALKEITTSKINLRLNSPGGSVFEGVTIANALRAHPASVTVYVDGIAASIASVIALAGERLVMMPQSQLMVHNASGACYGDSTEMLEMAKLLDKQSLNIAKAYAEHTGRPLAEWQQYMAEETWFSAEEAVEVGLADEAMPMRPKKGEQAEEPAAVAAVMNRAWDLSMYRYAGREKAPAPTAVKAPTLPGQRITAAFLSGIDVTGDIADTASPVEPKEIPGAEPGTITVDLLMGSEAFNDYVHGLIREALRAEQGPQNELVAEESGTQPDDSPAAPDGPGEEQQSAPDSGQVPPDGGPAPQETPPDDGGERTTETHNEADDWNSVIGLLHDPTSPGADDVFAHLKEGW